jgi:hypothetical protein
LIRKRRGRNSAAWLATMSISAVVITISVIPPE